MTASGPAATRVMAGRIEESETGSRPARDPAGPFVRLSYSWVWAATQQQGSADYHLRLTATRPRFGGCAGGSCAR
jgi:hypothetical protein